MAVIVGLLALLLPRPPRTLQSQLLSASIPIALSVVVRWMALLAALLAIGYLTKFSGHYSRRAMLTWAALGPVLIIVATLALHAHQALLPSSQQCPQNGAGRLHSVESRAGEKARPVLGIRDGRRRILRRPGAGAPEGRSRATTARQADGPGPVRTGHNIEVIFIALPVRQVARVMELLEELRDTTASIYYLPDIFVFDLIQALAASRSTAYRRCRCARRLFSATGRSPSGRPTC